MILLPDLVEFEKNLVTKLTRSGHSTSSAISGWRFAKHRRKHLDAILSYLKNDQIAKATFEMVHADMEHKQGWDFKVGSL